MRNTSESLLVPFPSLGYFPYPGNVLFAMRALLLWSHAFPTDEVPYCLVMKVFHIFLARRESEYQYDQELVLKVFSGNVLWSPGSTHRLSLRLHSCRRDRDSWRQRA